MGRRRARTIAALALLAVVPGCGSSRSEPVVPAAHIERGEDGAAKRVVLSPEAVERLGIELGRTSQVREHGRALVAVPGGAVIYDTTGRAFAYRMERPRTYVRTPLTILRHEGNRVLVRGGVRPGVPVAVTGADELLGTETGVEGE
jgi:hypothetical protein